MDNAKIVAEANQKFLGEMNMLRQDVESAKLVNGFAFQYILDLLTILERVAF